MAGCELGYAGGKQLFHGERGERYVSLFSCYDFRVDAGRFGVTKQALQRIVTRVSQLPPSLYTHIRDVRVFGFRTVVAEFPKRTLKVDGVNPAQLISRLPYSQFVSSIALPASDRVYVAYSVPGELVDDVCNATLEAGASSVDVGVSIPVRNCRASLRLDADTVKAFEEEFERVIRPPPGVKPHILDFIIVSLLDRQPLLTLNKMKSVSAIAGNDDGEADETIRYKYLLRHYRTLSSLGAVGRVRLSRLYWGATVPLMLRGERELAPRLYAIAASLLATSRMFVGEKYVYVSMAIPAEHLSGVMELLPVSTEVVVLRGGVRMPFPYEYFNPRSGRWQTEKVNVVEELRRHRLILRSHSPPSQ